MSVMVGGTVVAVNVVEGQFVKEGDTVIELDSRLEALETDRRKLIADDTSELDAARSRLETLRIDLEGTRKLRESGRSVSLEDLQKKELEYKLAEADVRRVESAEKREQAEHLIAEEQLQKRTIKAPFDGIIVELMLEVGESCNQQQPIFRIVDVRKCRLVIHMEQSAVLRLKTGKQVTVRIKEAEGAVTVPGTVEFISPLIDASSGLREVKVLFDNPDGKVHPGTPGTITSIDR